MPLQGNEPGFKGGIPTRVCAHKLGGMLQWHQILLIIATRVTTLWKAEGSLWHLFVCLSVCLYIDSMSLLPLWEPGKVPCAL